MRKTLYIAVFFSGLTTLAVEMTASRLLGNFFGTSNLVWASIIGLILIYLTAGYFLGGAWADRSPSFRTLFQIMLWGAFTIGLVPLVSRPVLRLAANAFDQLNLGILLGSFVAVMILFSIPITLLGTTSPFAIRLAIQDPGTSGTISGRIYAISTLGSFIGTFLPVLILVPLIGTYRTFLTFSGLLLIVALYGLARACGVRAVLPYLWMPIVIIVLAVLGVRGADKPAPGLVYETDSSYNYIQVLEDQGYRFLRLNEGQGMHSIYHPTQTNFYGPWEQVLAAPYFNNTVVNPSDVRSMAIVGLAAGTTARAATLVYPQITIDGIEIDPKIIQVAREYFDMNEPNLNVIIADGRVGLQQSNRLYQIISVDAYRPPYIPWHMTTTEFFQLTYDRLTPDGVLVINVGRAPLDRRLVDALYTTIRTVYPAAYIVDIPDSFNSIIFATKSPGDLTGLANNYERLSRDPATPPLLLDTLQRTVTNLQPAPAFTQVFTDDKAPIEWLTNAMVLNFYFSGQMETLQ